MVLSASWQGLFVCLFVKGDLFVRVGIVGVRLGVCVCVTMFNDPILMVGREEAEDATANQTRFWSLSRFLSRVQCLFCFGERCDIVTTLPKKQVSVFSARVPHWSYCPKPVCNFFLKNLYWTCSQLLTCYSLYCVSVITIGKKFFETNKWNGKKKVWLCFGSGGSRISL